MVMTSMGIFIPASKLLFSFCFSRIASVAQSLLPLRTSRRSHYWPLYHLVGPSTTLAR